MIFSFSDVQFYCFMRHVTDLGKKEIMLAFDMLDSDADGEINFEEFYILACILLSSKVMILTQNMTTSKTPCSTHPFTTTE